MTRRGQAGLLAGLLALLAVLVGWRAGYFGGGGGASPGMRPGTTASSAAREGAADWDGLALLAGAAPRAGTVDLFSRTAPPPPKARAAIRAPGPPPPPKEAVPELPPPPPPPPPEDPLEAVRKDLASYRFVGYLQKTGDMIVFLAAGNDVFLVKKGDVLGRTRTVVVRDIKEGEIVFLFPPDKRIRATLRDNAPLTVN